jgi:hypothetical protein
VWPTLVCVMVFLAWERYSKTRNSNDKESIEKKKEELSLETLYSDSVIEKEERINELLKKFRETMEENDFARRKNIEETGELKRNLTTLMEEIKDSKQYYEIQIKRLIKQNNFLKNILRKNKIEFKNSEDEGTDS